MHDWGKTSGAIELSGIDDIAYYDNNLLVNFSN